MWECTHTKRFGFDRPGSFALDRLSKPRGCAGCAGLKSIQSLSQSYLIFAQGLDLLSQQAYLTCLRRNILCEDPDLLSYRRYFIRHSHIVRPDLLL